MYNLTNIGKAKEFIDCWEFIPGFKESYQENPLKTVKMHNFNLHPDELALEDIDGCIKPKYSDTVMADYFRFVNDNYIRINRDMEVRTHPDNPKMSKWFDDCIARSLEQGIDKKLYLPMVFELSQGCSVGCPFCGLNADKLTGLFEGTNENIKFFEKIVDTSIGIIGEAAAKGILYYATEPLDNPDYEIFSDILYNRSGIIPQITTAVPLRDTERMKKLLKKLNDNPNTYYRFSVASVVDWFRIYEAYQPEELLFTLMEPRFSGSYEFAKSGRQAAHTNEFKGTISCIVGFVVNMCRQTISLRYLCDADKWNPTGEVSLCTVPFRDEIEFEELINEIIEKKM